MTSLDHLHFPASRRVLAMLFFPSPTEASAVKKMHRWLRDDPDLHEALRRSGYHPRQKLFSRRQAEVLLHFLG